VFTTERILNRQIEDPKGYKIILMENFKQSGRKIPDKECPVFSVQAIYLKK